MILEIDPVGSATISIGTVAQVVASLGTLGGICFAIFRLGRNTQKVKSGIAAAVLAANAQKDEVNSIKQEIRELKNVLIEMARTTTRLDALSGISHALEQGS